MKIQLPTVPANPLVRVKRGDRLITFKCAEGKMQFRFWGDRVSCQVVRAEGVK